VLKSRPYSLSKSSDELEDKGLLVDDTGWFLKKKIEENNQYILEMPETRLR
jgi:hypothetical protein